jgi:hypothetical protein
MGYECWASLPRASSMRMCFSSSRPSFSEPGVALLAPWPPSAALGRP